MIMKKDNFKTLHCNNAIQGTFLNFMPVDVESIIADFFGNNNAILSTLFKLPEDGRIPNSLDLRTSFSLPDEVRAVINQINAAFPIPTGVPNDSMAFDLIISRAHQYGQELDQYIDYAREYMTETLNGQSLSEE